MLHYHTYQEKTWSDSGPHEWPPVEHEEIYKAIADHGTDVVGEAAHAIEPRQTDGLDQAEDDQGKTSTVRVHKTDPVWSSLPNEKIQW